jgi:hypothetical protein
MENATPNRVAAALEKLDRAVLRLERAAERLKPELPRLAEVPKLEQSLAARQRENEILREAIGRVATRLDQVIGRLGAALKG